MEITQGGEKIMLADKFDYKLFGELLHRSWLLKRGLTTKITNNFIDEIYNIAIANGAIGGKLLGAGSGGFVLVFAEPKFHEKIRNSLSNLMEIPFKFETQGSSVLYYDKSSI